MKLLVFLSLMSGFLLAEPEVRVSISTPAARFVLTGDKGEKFELEAASSGIILNGKQTGQLILQIKADMLEIDSKKFRKIIEVKLNSDKLTLIHILPMESYITGVISSELPMSWPLEVLKAQAVAARTYAIWQMYKKEHLESSVMDQVYFGVQREHKLARQAVEETAAQVLTYEAKPAHTYFHACCGGHTASSEEVFGSKEPYLAGVSCPYCHNAPIYKWTYGLSRKELDQKLGVKVSNLESTGETASGRVKSFKFKSKPALTDMKSGDFRKTLGYNVFRSTLITKESLGSSKAEFFGRGHGHGVGMCQWGALEMAKKGKTFEEILTFYYPGTEIRKFY
ncbi:MAG: SpoIID/LytB domain-containing protein [Myxococcaceae bacterium]